MGKWPCKSDSDIMRDIIIAFTMKPNMSLLVRRQIHDEVKDAGWKGTEKRFRKSLSDGPANHHLQDVESLAPPPAFSNVQPGLSAACCFERNESDYANRKLIANHPSSRWFISPLAMATSTSPHSISGQNRWS